MKNTLYHQTTTATGYRPDFAERDIRTSPEQKQLINEVAEFLTTRTAATYRELSEKFKDRYRLNLALESLRGDNKIRLDESKQITVVRIGGSETDAERCARLGHMWPRHSSAAGNTDIHCGRCWKAKGGKK